MITLILILLPCGASEFEDTHLDILLNPAIIIEVLSESTEKYDRGKKANLYRQLETVQDYILVSQEKYQIEHYQRQNPNQWLLTVLNQAEQVLQLTSVQAEIKVQDIYDKVVF
ncbi:Uma2 family endonuclease [Candidatus Albibeggiatoa sp. nov. BB20]|uniref:Uma2 family endonuclease n=1 Tax=Candidatus Albibeggiatoa sp. nov. BB20 TaxID=3162723 RepID=UPI0033657BF3